MSVTVTFDVEVVDGEGLAVPDLEVGARYRYRAAPGTWSSGTTDGDGIAEFRDEHEERPLEVCLFVGDEDCGSHSVENGAHVLLEL